MPASSRPKQPQMLGAHFSIAGGLHQAVFTAHQYGCSALQLFTQNSRTWKERILNREEIETFGSARKKTGISAIAAHGSYLINPAAADPKKRQLSITALTGEMKRASMLEIPFVVLHPGAHMGSGEHEAIRRIARSIRTVLSETPENGPCLLLETVAGQGTSVGRSFEQLAALLERIDAPRRTGICLDTCHIFAAGYELRSASAYEETMRQFDRVIGFERLHVIHLNDSQKPLGSRVDRHAHIGRGEIGLEAFGRIMQDKRLAHALKILETPKGGKGDDWDAVNLGVLRKLC